MTIQNWNILPDTRNTPQRNRTKKNYVALSLEEEAYPENSHALRYIKFPFNLLSLSILIIIMYIYHALINALSAHMIYINLNMIFYTHVEHSPTETIYIKYYLKN